MTEYHGSLANDYAKQWIAYYFGVRVPYFNLTDPMDRQRTIYLEEACKELFVDYLATANGMEIRNPKLAIVEN